MNRADIQEWIAHPNAALNRMQIPEFKALCQLALRNMKAGFSVPPSGLEAGEADVWLAVESHELELAALRSKVAELDAANVGLAQESHDLQQICRDAYEVWAGSEGIPAPQTAAEAYLLQLLKNMKDEVKRGLK